MDFHEVQPGNGRIKVGHEFASPDIAETCYTHR